MDWEDLGAQIWAKVGTQLKVGIQSVNMEEGHTVKNDFFLPSYF